MAIVASASGAGFSPCRRWRYTLWRRWDELRPAVNFLMLNPSTADEVDLDPTCARAQGYAMRWGYGALIVTNVFAWRATDPRAMKAADDPVGPRNDHAIVAAAREAALVVCAWGNDALHLGRAARVLELLKQAGRPLHVLKLNAGGQPAHPLYLDGRLKPARWAAPQG